MTNVLPRFLGIKKLFFLRFVHNLKTNKIDINKELHLNRKHHPHGNGLDEHYCRRWISVTLLQDLQKMMQNTENTEGPLLSVEHIIGIQRSRFFGTSDEYLCLTIARPAGVRNVSITIGILIDNESRNKIRFLNDDTTTSREVNTTCERCSVINCAERAVEPLVVQRRQQRQNVNEALKKILD
jgi:XRE family transcriptional regulator, fatty acid utilization regulator